MNNLTTTSEKMSSKRIAEKTGKTHSNVLRDIRQMIEELRKVHDSNLNDSEYQQVIDNRGYISEILLNERLSLCLASGYSVTLRMAIIDDWAAMKAKQSEPKSREQLLAESFLLAQQVLAEREQQIKQLAPKAEFTDIVLKSTTCHTVTEIAKELGMTAQELNKKLCDRGVQFKHRDHYVLYSNYANKGYTDTETVPYIGTNGETMTRIQTVWTEYGRVFIHSLFNSQLSFSKVQRVA